MKLIDFLGSRSPPIGSDLHTGGVHSPPLMDYSSLRLYYLHGHKKNPMKRLETFHLQWQRWRPATSSPSRLIRRVSGHEGNRRPSSRSRSHPTEAKVHSEKKQASEYEVEEEGCNDVSTELVLRYDPYKVKKKLKKSDLGHLSRLLILRAGVTTHLLPYLDEARVRRVESGEGADVVVWDVNTHSEHRPVFAYWASSRSYVLKGCRIKEFVQQRGLADGHEIRIYWDPIASRFHFSLLRKAN
ncbi:hypothetical protein BT93_E1341 [Corymbia citriodora subsp. variegata]|nr:hypothetical protein BT93_E1341 [Corymbia citriodora subsp. variegata]